MKKINLSLLLLIAVVLSSCVSMKKMIYLQGSEDLVNMPQRIADTYAIRLKPNDIVYVTVTGYNEELMKPFKNSQMLGSNTSNSQQGAGFLIDPQGYITLPYVGKIVAAGKTTNQLSEDIRKRLIAEDYMKEPNVTVRMADYKISVMGEVKNPGQKTITGERVTILEALSMAGDLPETARRDSILVVREDRGLRSAYYIDLTKSADIFNSPAYYLQQNDVVYVKPNNTARVKGSSTFSTLAAAGSVIGIVSSIIALIAVFTK